MINLLQIIDSGMEETDYEALFEACGCIFVCMVLLIAIILITIGYFSGTDEAQIKGDLKVTGAGRDAEIMHFKKINNSIVAIIKDGDATQCVRYDKFHMFSRNVHMYLFQWIL